MRSGEGWHHTGKCLVGQQLWTKGDSFLHITELWNPLLEGTVDSRSVNGLKGIGRLKED